jgi:hypothetical protein
MACDALGPGDDVLIVSMRADVAAKHADIAPDGSRAAWISDGQLFLSDEGILDPAEVLKEFAQAARSRSEDADPSPEDVE